MQSTMSRHQQQQSVSSGSCSALMAILTTFSLAFFIFFPVSSQAYEGVKVKNVKAGENVTLDCFGPTHAPIEVLKWIRPDLKSDGYVFFYRDNQESYQHPLFVGRVQLRDTEMKDGDVSVILRSVHTNDTGTYECHVSVTETGRRKRAYSELRCVINVRVTGSGVTHQHTWFRNLPGFLQLAAISYLIL